MPKIILAAHGRITSKHGQNIGRGFPHRGIDQGHNEGTPYDLEIRAPADGIVTFAGEFGSYGLCMFITHRDGWVTVLAHHAKQLVRKGAWVKQSQLIAVMGNSGTKYVHSHQELRDNTSRQLDPLEHLVTTAAAGSTPVAVPVPVAPTRRKKSMSTLYHTTRPGKPMEWALAGDGQGEAAWLPVDNATAQLLAAVHGSSIPLSPTSYDSFKRRYLSAPAATSAPVDTAAIASATVAAFKAAL